MPDQLMISPKTTALTLTVIFFFLMVAAALKDPNILIGASLGFLVIWIIPMSKSSREPITLLAALKRFSVALGLAALGVASLLTGRIEEFFWLFITMGFGIAIMLRTELFP